jgi:hypothetical protein
MASRKPVDRGKQGLKRSTVTDATGVPLHLVAAGANRHDAPLLGPTLAGGSRSGCCRTQPEATTAASRARHWRTGA